MRLAYVDTSCLVAIAFDEDGARTVAHRLAGFDRLLSSNLLEAELRAALIREGVDDDGRRLLLAITWVFPNRPLTRELDRIGTAGYLKGTDLWHLACALFLAPDGRHLTFATLDKRQNAMAMRLGLTPLS